MEHRVAVLATAHGYKDSIPLFEHAETRDGSRHVTAKLFLEDLGAALHDRILR